MSLVFQFDSGRLTHVFKGSILFVVKQDHPGIVNDYKILGPIVVIIPSSAAVAMKKRIQTRFLRDVLESSAPQIVIKGCPALRATVGNKNIDSSITVIV